MPIQIEQVSVSELFSPEWNPRQASERQYNDLKKSIERFGFVDPVIVNKKNQHIVGGNFRVRVARDMGLSQVPAVFVDLSDEQEKELNIRLNQNTGEWDLDLLANFDKELLKEWGFDLNDLNINIDKIPMDLEKSSDDKMSKCPNCGFEF